MILKDLLEVTNVNVIIMHNSCEMAIIKSTYCIGLLVETALNKTVKKIETRSDMIKVWLEDDQ